MEDEVVSSQEESVEETIETPQVESETSEETPSEVEQSPADVSDQPTEEKEEPEKKPRAETRIHELAKRAKEAESEVAYWKQLAAQAVPSQPIVTEDGTYSAEQIADVILQKQNAQKIEEQKLEATKSMQKDIAETLQSHPDLDQDDELAEIVYNFALSKGISLKSAADKIKARISTEKVKAEKKVIAEKALKGNVSSPQGSSVSTGETPPPDVNNMYHAPPPVEY